MEDSENTKIENTQKEKTDSEQVEVEDGDFGEVIELHPEPVTVAEENNTLEQSGSSEVTAEDKGIEILNAFSEPEAPVKELVPSEVFAVASDQSETKATEEAALPISDTNVVESSGVVDSISKGNVADSSEVSAFAYDQSQRKATEEAALPISATNVVESSGVVDSSSKENVADSLEQTAVVAPGDAANGGGDRELSENLGSTDRQPAAVLTAQTRTSWTSCCGLFDALRGSNQ